VCVHCGFIRAYGLLEFSDMSQVHPVEPQLIERVKTWLLSRRDGKGQFMRGGRYVYRVCARAFEALLILSTRAHRRALDDFGRAPVEITNAYICWALSEAKLPAESFAKVPPLAGRGRVCRIVRAASCVVPPNGCWVLSYRNWTMCSRRL
jgi:hypothetical protein